MNKAMLLLLTTMLINRDDLEDWGDRDDQDDYHDYDDDGDQHNDDQNDDDLDDAHDDDDEWWPRGEYGQLDHSKVILPFIDVDDHDEHHTFDDGDDHGDDDDPDDDHDYEKQPPGEYDMPWDHSNVIWPFMTTMAKIMIKITMMMMVNKIIKYLQGNMSSWTTARPTQ